MNRVSLVVQDYLVLRDSGNVFLRDDVQAEDKAREVSRVAQLDAFRACPFQQGFASEGLLCNEPPLPLRVLDFLEGQDIINLSLVCKSMHQAAHVLFKREVWPSYAAFQATWSIGAATLSRTELMRKYLSSTATTTATASAATTATNPVQSYLQGFPQVGCGRCGIRVRVRVGVGVRVRASQGPWQTYWGSRTAQYFLSLFDDGGVSSVF
jgi:hypothetical protein